jgi:hypothetical protein
MIYLCVILLRQFSLAFMELGLIVFKLQHFYCRLSKLLKESRKKTFDGAIKQHCHMKKLSEMQT